MIAFQRLPLYALLVTLWLTLNVSLLVVRGVSSVDIKTMEFLKEKEDIIKTLGLKYPERKAPNRKIFLAKKYSAPKFMLSLFNEVQNEDDGDGESLHTTNKGGHFIERNYLNEGKVDTVISFFKYVRVDAWKHSLGDVKLKFKVTFTPETEQVKGGEFKVYKRLPRNKSMADILCTMSMYAIKPEGNQPVLLNTQDVRAWEAGWFTFNVTSVMKQWALFPLTNYGFQLVVRTSTGDEVNPRDFGVVGTHGNRQKRPYLLGFVNTRKSMHSFTQEIISSDNARRTRRASNWQKQVRPRTCHLQKFFVDFRDIGLQDTIITPKGYHAHYCTGTCVEPLEIDANATNHAMIQALAHLLDTANVPDPCCAPNALKPISVLFFDDNGNIVLKKHAEMVATSCACQ